jgi:hypothetical protein
VGNSAQPRLSPELIVRVWGMGADGRAFFQNVHAHDLTPEGAHLSGLEHELKVGDTIGVQLAEQKARCRVLWAIDAGAVQKIQIGIELLQGQQCPWKKEIAAAPATKPPLAPNQPGANRRRFARHKISFPLELRDGRSGPCMQTNATDISGCGCYVETLIPMPLGTEVKLSFWMESEKINTTGLVKASDPGVGMGIEFTGMNIEAQNRLQRLLEKLDPNAGGLGRGSDSGMNPSRTTY